MRLSLTQARTILVSCSLLPSFRSPPCKQSNTSNSTSATSPLTTTIRSDFHVEISQGHILYRLSPSSNGLSAFHMLQNCSGVSILSEPHPRREKIYDFNKQIECAERLQEEISNIVDANCPQEPTFFGREMSFIQFAPWMIRLTPVTKH